LTENRVYLCRGDRVSANHGVGHLSPFISSCN
jgi:hypothetical protein